MGIILGTVIGIAVGATALGLTGNSGAVIPGLTIALSHIPSTVHGYNVVSNVKDALVGGAGGGVIGAAVSAVAKIGGSAATPGP